ncbi:LIM and SH3 domain protein Lasp-like isoform X2 [Portunus trituberculatus]|nr:LIM and SH3 domain protein Lasp-like isoform X2 [Portunus trituberculatus]
MTLSMKTYKGFNKLPYCEAHIPKAKATTVAETPEMRRLAENTKIQSNVQYHADFEKNKAKFTQVADDPETQRLKKNTQIISNVVYHGEMAKKSEMERKRAEPNEEDEERSSWHDTVGGGNTTATASVHQSKASHLQHDTDDDHAYDYDQDISEPSSNMHHSQHQRSYHHQYSPNSSAYSNKHSRARSISPHYSDRYTDPHVYGSSPSSDPHTYRTPPSTDPHTYGSSPSADPHIYRRSSSPSQALISGAYYPPEYIEDDRYYPETNSPGGYVDPNNRYSAQPTVGPTGSPHTTNRYYSTNNYYATGPPPPREDDMRQEQLHLQMQQQQQQQQQHQQQHQQQQKQQQLQKHHQQLPQQHQQQYTSPHQQQYSGPPPSSQHRHPSQPSSTSFLHHQQPYQQHPHKQQLPPTSSYHHHPAPQNMYHDANHNSPYSSRTSQTLIYSSQTGPVHQQPTRRVGSIADYDPVNEQYGSITQHNANPAGGGYRQETTYQVQRTNLYGDQNMGQQPPPSQMNSNATHHKVTAPPTQLGRCYRAMYDYEAADTDEVSFKDGDLIINCTAIDEGWMTGTIQRTGVTGMLPANYVERVS